MAELRFADTASAPWRHGTTGGVRFRCQLLLDGEDGGPEAFRFQFEPTPSVYAHMHLTSQFQLLLAGEMAMPRGRMDLTPLCVHYTDHNVPYGPFSTGPGHDMLVLHPQAGGLVPMADADARRHINLGGRLLVASPDAESWRDSAAGERRKLLIERGADLRVELVEAERGVSLDGPAPRYGRYDVVVDGTVSVGGRDLTGPGLRYALGEEPVLALLVTSAHATVMRLSFDADARRTGEGASTMPALLAASAAI